MAEESVIQSELESQRQRVDVEHVDMTVRELVRMAAEGELIRAPEYQRKFRWTELSESRLIESILLGLPVPAIYVAANPNGSWELVDGLQRVSALIHFTAEGEVRDRLLDEIGREGSLVLCELEKLPSLNGLTFADLPTPVRLSFMKRMLRVTALSDKSDREVRFDLFERLNTGGVALSPQEVRSCVYKGKFSVVLDELAGSPDFKALIKLQRRRERDGTREEQVLKFFAYLDYRDEFKGDVKGFLNKCFEKMSNLEDFSRMKEEFSGVIFDLRKVVDGAFVRPGYALTPLNQFEAVLVAAAELRREGEPLAPLTGWLSDRSLVEASTGGTNSRSMLQRRIERARELLRGAVPEPYVQAPDEEAEEEIEG